MLRGHVRFLTCEIGPTKVGALGVVKVFAFQKNERTKDRNK